MFQVLLGLSVIVAIVSIIALVKRKTVKEPNKSQAKPVDPWDIPSIPNSKRQF